MFEKELMDEHRLALGIRNAMTIGMKLQFRNKTMTLPIQDVNNNDETVSENSNALNLSEKMDSCDDGMILKDLQFTDRSRNYEFSENK